MPISPLYLTNAVSMMMDSGDPENRRSLSVGDQNPLSLDSDAWPAFCKKEVESNQSKLIKVRNDEYF